jgi:hypothetical protein
MAERAVDGYVAALPDGQREIAEAVRRLVRSVARGEEACNWAQPVFESGGPFERSFGSSRSSDV